MPAPPAPPEARGSLRRVLKELLFKLRLTSLVPTGLVRPEVTARKAPGKEALP